MQNGRRKRHLLMKPVHPEADDDRSTEDAQATGLEAIYEQSMLVAHAKSWPSQVNGIVLQVAFT